jgi:hypothetical protein
MYPTNIADAPAGGNPLQANQLPRDTVKKPTEDGHGAPR